MILLSVILYGKMFNYQISADRFVLNLKMWNFLNTRYLFSYCYSTICQWYCFSMSRPLLPSSQLLGQSGLLSQGATAVIHGSSKFMHWATIRIKSKQLTLLPSWRVSRVKGNTPDFILEHFIIYFSAYSGRPPFGGVSSLTVMTVVAHTKHTAKSAAKKPYKMHNKQALQSCFIILLQLQQITKIRSAPRRDVSEKVAKTLRMAQTAWLWCVWSHWPLEWCQYPPGELQCKTSKTCSNELN